MAAESAMNEILAAIGEAGAISDDKLLLLHFLCGKNLKKALRIVDGGGVRRITARPSGRSAFQVRSESASSAAARAPYAPYACFPAHFCSCPSFHFEVVSRRQQLCCKHQLAARLAQSLRLANDDDVRSTVSDEELALLLLAV